MDLINEEENALQKHEEIKGREVTGTPCIYELSKFAKFDPADIFIAKEILDFKIGDAKAAGRIYYQLCKEGEILAEIDIIIAGMVKDRDLILLTRDSDFQRIPGIEVETY